MERPKADSFITFLETQQRMKPSAPSSLEASPLKLLFKLAEFPEHQLQVTKLMAASGMAFTDFAEALKNLKDSGYLTLIGPPSNEEAALTELGEGVSRLAKLE